MKKPPIVCLLSRKWLSDDKQEQHDYEIYLNQFLLRKFSTYGETKDINWGAAAKSMAEQYAKRVAKEIGAMVMRGQRRNKNGY